MRPLAFPLLADENIPPDVVRALVDEGYDVRTAVAEGVAGLDDLAVLRRAHASGRVVLTHDADFGALAIHAGEPFTGIIHLRPGHISVEFVVVAIRAIAASAIDVEPPFILVADRRDERLRIRVRKPGRWGRAPPSPAPPKPAASRPRGPWAGAATARRAA